MKKNFEEINFPNLGKLRVEKDNDGLCVFAHIMDAEMDIVSCLFPNDESVLISTEGQKYVCFSIENLQKLIKLIKESKMLYEENSSESETNN